MYPTSAEALLAINTSPLPRPTTSGLLIAHDGNAVRSHYYLQSLSDAVYNALGIILIDIVDKYR